MRDIEIDTNIEEEEENERDSCADLEGLEGGFRGSEEDESAIDHDIETIKCPRPAEHQVWPSPTLSIIYRGKGTKVSLNFLPSHRGLLSEGRRGALPILRQGGTQEDNICAARRVVEQPVREPGRREPSSRTSQVRLELSHSASAPHDSLPLRERPYGSALPIWERHLISNVGVGCGWSASPSSGRSSGPTVRCATKLFICLPRDFEATGPLSPQVGLGARCERACGLIVALLVTKARSFGTCIPQDCKRHSLS